MKTKTPFLKPNLVKKEAYLGYLSQIDESRVYSNYGPLNGLFECRLLGEYFQGEGAVTTVNNATIGLMLAISKSRRMKGRYALMPSFTFPATPLAAIWCGLEPYFIDIRRDDWCMDESILKKTLERMGDRAACVVTYATFGTCLNLSYYEALHRSGTPVIIDAASSFGTSSESGYFGQGFPGPVVFSFHATKTFGIGEGGLVYSGNSELISRIRHGGNFGFSPERETVEIGLNSKLCEYIAAIALATLDVFPEKIQVRQDISRWYIEEMTSRGFFQAKWAQQKTIGIVPRQVNSFLCPPDRTNRSIVQTLQGKGIEARTYFSPACHQQQLFSSFKHSDLAVTEELSSRVINLPTWEEMDRDDVRKVVAILSEGKEA